MRPLAFVTAALVFVTGCVTHETSSMQLAEGDVVATALTIEIEEVHEGPEDSTRYHTTKVVCTAISSDPKVVGVAQTGQAGQTGSDWLVWGVGRGTATITLTACDDSETEVIDVVVTPAG